MQMTFRFVCQCQTDRRRTGTLQKSKKYRQKFVQDLQNLIGWKFCEIFWEKTNGGKYRYLFTWVISGEKIYCFDNRSCVIKRKCLVLLKFE